MLKSSLADPLPRNSAWGLRSVVAARPFALRMLFHGGLGTALPYQRFAGWTLRRVPGVPNPWAHVVSKNI